MDTTQVPAGYKVTELGVLPEEWEVKTLGKCAFVTKLAGFEYTLHFNSYKTPGSIIVIRGTNITNNRLDLSDVRTIPEATSKGLKRSKLSSGDLVFAYVGTIGPVYLVEDDNRFHLGPNTAKITPNAGLLPSFLLSFFKSSFLKAEITEHTSIGAQPSLSMTKIRSFKIPLPPLPEQKAVAAALDEIDALMSAQQKRLAKQRAVKQGLLQGLLSGEKRLPGFAGKWEVKSLLASTDCLDNLRVPLNESQRASMRGDIPYCGANNVVDFVNDYVVDDDIILVAEDGGYFDEFATRPIAYRMSGKCWVNNHAHILKAKKSFAQDFIFYSLVHKDITQFIASGTRAKLNRSELNKIEISAPPLAEQEAIAAVLNEADAYISALEAEHAKTQLLKQGMMQNLLTGKIRLV